MDTNAQRPAEEVIHEIAQKTLELLEAQGIAMDQCVGAGIGVPGTVDTKNIFRFRLKLQMMQIVQHLEKQLQEPEKNVRM